MFCTKCGTQTTEHFCGACGAATALGAVAGPGINTRPMATADSIVYGGFWIRFAAWTIDALLLSIVGSLLGEFVGGFIGGAMGEGGSSLDDITAVVRIVCFTLGLATNWLYFTLLESSSWQGTIGKHLLHLNVTDDNLQRMKFGRANKRYWFKVPSGLPLFYGFIVAASDKRHQALHDRWAHTYVIVKDVSSLVPARK